MIERLPDENELDFHKRIVLGKLVDKTVDDDYSELAEKAYGEKSSSDHCRKMMYGSRYTIDLYERFFESLLEDNCEEEILDKIEMANIELKKERIKLQDQKTEYRRLIREQARRETTKDIVEEVMKNIDFPALKVETCERESQDSTMLISLSDLHIGACVDNHWNKYDIDIAKERLEQYLEKIIKVNSKEKCKKAIVYANGDIVSGIIHPDLRYSSKYNLIEQVQIASELITQFLTMISANFEEVGFCSVPGNHSRLTENKANSPLKERADDWVEFYLRARLKELKNINFDVAEKIDSTICLLSLHGKNFAVVHGDMDSEQKTEALQKFCGVDLYGVLTGHMHHMNVKDVRNIKIIQSGSLMGQDSFTVSNRIFGKPSQLISICNEGGIECFYEVTFE